MHNCDRDDISRRRDGREYAGREEAEAPEAPEAFRQHRRGRQCPDCPHEEPRCGECERRGGREREDRFPGDRREEMDRRGPEHSRFPEGREHGEDRERPEPHVPRTALGKLALCGRLAEQHRGRRRGQMHILRILEENGSMSQRVLQELLRIQPGSMSEIAAKLEAAGLILRERSEEDRRRVTVSITEKGKETLAAQPKGAPDTLEPLTEEEQETLSALLDKLIAAWGAERRGHRHGGFGPERGPVGPRPPMRPGPGIRG